MRVAEISGTYCLFVAALLAWIAPAQAQVVGRTEGVFAVSAAGEATYTIPIWTPDGVRGMSPQLALRYGHRGRDGLLGVGWSLSGLSQIAQCVRTTVNDGAPSPVDYAPQRYCLDGSRLIGVSGSYTGAGSEYRTELETYSRVRSFGTAGFGPAYFEVEGADGLIREYGATSDSRIIGENTVGFGGTNTPYVWALNRVRDRSGNAIEYVYTRDATTGAHRLSYIDYTRNTSQSLLPRYRVSFVYETKTASDTDLAYLNGGRVRQLTRLARIDVTHDGSVVRRYTLAYEATLSTAGQTRLATVTQCGVGGTSCFAPTSFTWQNGTAGVQAEVGTAATVGAGGSWEVLDVNGDGFDDVVYLSSSGSTLRQMLGGPSGLGAATDTGIAADFVGFPAYYDDDDTRDLVDYRASTQTWRAVLGSGTGLTSTATTGIAIDQDLIDARLQDVTGDGRDDLLQWSILQAGGVPNVTVRPRVSGGSFGTSTYLNDGFYGTLGQFLPATRSKPASYDGAARGDFVLDASDHWYLVNNGQLSLIDADSALAPPSVADVNGDGCADLAFWRYSASQWRIRFSGCGAFVNYEVAGSTTSFSGGSVFGVAFDWNGDGKQDLIGPNNAGTQLLVIPSTGETLGTAITTTIANPSGGFKVGDINGDGLDDLIYVTGGTVRYRLHSGVRPDLLVSAVDGFGVGVTFAYASLTDSAVYTKYTTATFPQRNLRDTRAVVKTATATDRSGTGSTYTLTYYYEGAKRDLQGRGDLGFAYRSVTDSRTNIAERWTFSQTFPQIGGVVQAYATQGNTSTYISFITNSWAAVSASYAGGTTQFPYIQSSQTSLYEVGGTYNGTKYATVSRTVNALSSGVPTNTTVVYTENATGLNVASTKTVNTSITTLEDTTNWCIGRPQLTQTTSSHSLAEGAAIIRSVNQTWDALKCRPTQVDVEPSSLTLKVTTVLGYDGVGNVSSEAVTGIGMATRTTQYNWGSRKQALESITNALSQTTLQAWNYGLTLPSSITDPNSLTTSWTYDAFGRLATETRADGTSSDWTWSSCPSGCDTRVRSYVTARAKSTAGIAYRTDSLYFDQFDQLIYDYRQLPMGGQSIVEANFRDSLGLLRFSYVPYVSGAPHNGYRAFTYDALSRVTAAQLYTASGTVDRGSSVAYAGLAVSVTDTLSHTSTVTRTAWGDRVRVSDALGGSTNYQFDAFGNPRKVIDAYGTTISDASYNVRGMRVALFDVDRGTTTFTPNALGELTSTLNANSQTTSYGYDALGRMTSRSEPEGSTTWTWGTSSAAKNIGRLQSVSGLGVSEALTYDSKGRPATKTITSDATYLFDYAWNDIGKLHTLTYPTSTAGVRVKLKYAYSNGYLSQVRNFTGDVDGTNYWTLTSTDARGVPIDESLGNGLRLLSTTDPMTGFLTARQSGTGGSTTNVQNLAYEWDRAANLVRREDLRQSLSERFYYDAGDRLDYSTLNGSTNGDVTLDLIGNITYKMGIGTYAYHPTKKHAVTTAGSETFTYDAIGNMLTGFGGTASWYSSGLPNQIQGPSTAGTTTSQFWYGPGRDRWKQVTAYAGINETTIYVGGLVEKVTQGTVTTWKHYIGGFDDSVGAVMRRSDGINLVIYFARDHLGSLDTVTDAAGAVQVRLSYDAWGRRRSPVTWSFSPSGSDYTAINATTDRGYTGHEMLDNLSLVHMNGRIYRPGIGRFISADPYADGYGEPGGYNRYAYVSNNPLSNVDPSGFQAAKAQDYPDSPWAQRPDPTCPLPMQGACNVYAEPWDDEQWIDWWGITDPCGQFGNAQTCRSASIPYGQNVPAAASYTSVGVLAVDVNFSGGAITATISSPLATRLGDVIDQRLTKPINRLGDRMVEDAISFDQHTLGLASEFTTAYGTLGSTLTEDNLANTLFWASVIPTRGQLLASRVGAGAADAVAVRGASAGAMRRATFDEIVSAQRHVPGVARRGAAPGPINGQAALDVSLQVSANSSRRVGIDYAERQFVVFDEHAPGMFHGHVRSWTDLTQAMQATLRRAGMADARGSIVRGSDP